MWKKNSLKVDYYIKDIVGQTLKVKLMEKSCIHAYNICVREIIKIIKRNQWSTKFHSSKWEKSFYALTVVVPFQKRKDFHNYFEDHIAMKRTQ